MTRRSLFSTITAALGSLPFMHSSGARLHKEIKATEVAMRAEIDSWMNADLDPAYVAELRKLPHSTEPIPNLAAEFDVWFAAAYPKWRLTLPQRDAIRAILTSKTFTSGARSGKTFCIDLLKAFDNKRDSVYCQQVRHVWEDGRVDYCRNRVSLVARGILFDGIPLCDHCILSIFMICQKCTVDFRAVRVGRLVRATDGQTIYRREGACTSGIGATEGSLISECEFCANNGSITASYKCGCKQSTREKDSRRRGYHRELRDSIFPWTISDSCATHGNEWGEYTEDWDKPANIWQLPDGFRKHLKTLTDPIYWPGAIR